MTIPTKGEEYAKLIEHVRLAQESAAMLAHLYRDGSKNMADGWLTVSEAMRAMQFKITQLATKGLQ